MARALADASLPGGAAILGVCTGTGMPAITAARAGAGSATAIDVSAQTVAVAWSAAGSGTCGRTGPRRRHESGGPADVRRGAGQPAVRSLCGRGRSREGRRRAWDAGARRAVLDRLCVSLPLLLNRNGFALIMHSELCGTETSRDNDMRNW